MNEYMDLKHRIDETYYPAWNLINPWVEMLVEHARLKRGEKVLDIGTGRGWVAQRASLITKTIGGTHAIDKDPDLLSHAQTTHAEADIIWLHGDLSELPFQAEIFDCVIGNQMFQLLSDPKKNSAEIFRVIRTGGRLVLNVYDRLELCPAHQAVAKILKCKGVDTEPLKIMHSLHDPIKLGDIIATSGFKDISVVRKTHEARFTSLRTFYSALAAEFPSLRLSLENLIADESSGGLSDVKTALRDYIDDDGLRVLTTSNFLFARRR